MVNFSLSFKVGIMFTLGLLFMLSVSIFAAFLPTAPFQSPYSDFIRFIYKIFPNYPLPGLREYPNTFRISSMILVSIAFAALAAFGVIKQGNTAYLSFLAFPLACVVALASPRPEKMEEMKPRIYGLPAWALFASFTTIAVLSISAWMYATHNHPAPFIISFSFACALIPLQGYHLIQISKSAPDTTTAEAVTWMLLNSKSSSQSATWFLKAARIGSSKKTSKVKRAVLLEKLLPLLSPLITSIPHHPPAALHPDLVAYVTCLALLCDFDTSTDPFWKQLWHNEVAFPRPLFPKDLEEKLTELCTCKHCPQKVKRYAIKALDFSENMAGSQHEKEKLSETSVS
jgi:hypothetical protein